LFEKEPLAWIPRFFFKAGVQEAEEDTMSDVHTLALAMESPPAIDLKGSALKGASHDYQLSHNTFRGSFLTGA